MSWLSDTLGIKWNPVKDAKNLMKDLTNPGWKQQEKANSLFEQSIAKKGQNNAFLKNFTNKLLYGENGKPGSMETAGSWARDYLAHLKSSPDTAFNAGMASLNKAIQGRKDAVAKSMANRGISGSGIDLGRIAQTEANRARGISALQGEKVDREGANLAAGANFANLQNADNINLLLKSLGFDSDNSTLMAYVNNLWNQGQNANQNSPFNQAVGAATKYYLGKWFPTGD